MYKLLTEFITYRYTLVNYITGWQMEENLDEDALEILFELIDNDLCDDSTNEQLHDIYIHVLNNKEEYTEALCSGDICNVVDVMEEV